MAFEKAYNDHDAEKIVSFYTEDAVHEVPGVFTVRGTQELRDLTEHDVVLNTSLSVDECETAGDTVTCRLAFMSDWTRAAGIGEVRYSARFVFSDDLIKEFTAEISPEGAEAFSSVFGPLLSWASKERPEQVKEMMPEGRFVYNAENAKRSLALLQEWQRGTSQTQ
jgi:hypothetical protein